MHWTWADLMALPWSVYQVLVDELQKRYADSD